LGVCKRARVRRNRSFKLPSRGEAKGEAVYIDIQKAHSSRGLLFLDTHKVFKVVKRVLRKTNMAAVKVLPEHVSIW